MSLEEILATSVKAALDAQVFEADFYDIDGMSGKRFRFFLNHLIKSLPTPNYLEVGLWAGSTFCSAISANKVCALGIDNWEGIPATHDKPGIGIVPAPRREFHKNLMRTLEQSPDAHVSVVEKDFRAVDCDSKTVNVFFFDGPHDYAGQEEGIRHFLPFLADEFILIVDDWNWEDIRHTTGKVLKMCNLTVVTGFDIRTKSKGDYHPGLRLLDDWHNGCLIALVKKPAEETREIAA